MPRRPGDLSPLERLRMRLSAIRSAQSGDSWDGLPLGGDLRGPWRSEGYAQLVAKGLQYAWTWQGNRLPDDAF